MSGRLILPPGVEGTKATGDAARPVELTEDKWPYQVQFQFPGCPAVQVIVTCGKEEDAFVRAWRMFLGEITTIHRLDAIEAVEYKKQVDEKNGFGDAT